MSMMVRKGFIKGDIYSSLLKDECKLYRKLKQERTKSNRI